MKKFMYSILVLLSPFFTNAQQTVGLFLNTPDSFDGYTLFTTVNSQVIYLIDNCGEQVHSWTSSNNARTPYLLENGNLLCASKIAGSSDLTLVEMLDWNSNQIWTYDIGTIYGNQHHDIEILPNGNILLIAYDIRTKAEVEQAGGSTSNATIKSDRIIEIQPDLVNGGATIVWEWKAWDHLIQDVDPAKPNYGVIANSTELIDINAFPIPNSDWLHVNSIDYNASLDQIILSVPRFNEIWIIDHSTTTAEAASASGGTYNQGGDLLYRWGNPSSYNQGTSVDQKLFFQHHAHWIPASYPDGGKIMVFNNRAGEPFGQDYSEVNIIDPPIVSNGFYTYSSGAYDPVNFYWNYQSSPKTDFYSRIISGAERLENGNTLICEGTSGRFFEIDANGLKVWEYVNPVNNNGPVQQYSSPGNNNTFRATRIAPNYPGLAGQNLAPQGYIESGSTFSCTLYPSCIDSVDIITPIISDTTIIALNHITANSLIELTSNVVFQAGSFITLLPGFEIELGASLEIQIDICPQ